MNWITRLFLEINELIAVMAAKLNKLYTDKEDKANKKQTLTSTNNDDYPSVPAVRLGLDNTLQAAQNLMVIVHMNLLMVKFNQITPILFRSHKKRLPVVLQH